MLDHHIYGALGSDTDILLDSENHLIPQAFNPLGQNRMLTEQETDSIQMFVQKCTKKGSNERVNCSRAINTAFHHM